MAVVKMMGDTSQSSVETQDFNTHLEDTAVPVEARPGSDRVNYRSIAVLIAAEFSDVNR